MVVESRNGTVPSPGSGGMAADLRCFSGVDEDGVGDKMARPAGGQVHFHRAGTSEPGCAHQQVHAAALDGLLAPAAKALHDGALALPHSHHVNRNRAGLHAVVGGAPGQVGHAGAGYHRLGRRAAHVHAGAAHVLAFDHRRPAPGSGKSGGEGSTGLSVPDNERVIALFVSHCYASCSALATAWAVMA